VDDTEIQNQRYRVFRVCKVRSQINVPTIPTVNHPVVGLFDNRVSGTSTEMVSHRVHLKLPDTTSR
jgi:hypothetical protein